MLILGRYVFVYTTGIGRLQHTQMRDISIFMISIYSLCAITSREAFSIGITPTAVPAAREQSVMIYA